MSAFFVTHVMSLGFPVFTCANYLSNEYDKGIVMKCVPNSN